MPIHIPGVIEAEPSRRMTLTVSPERLIGWLHAMREPKTYSVAGLPSDALVVSCGMNDRGQIVIVLESDDFRQVPAGNVYMEADIRLTEYTVSVPLHR